jgi:hypothetical protein
MKAQDYLNKVNETEKYLNSIGRSLRTNGNDPISRMVTSKKYLDDKVKHFRKPVRPRLSETEFKNYIDYNNKFA